MRKIKQWYIDSALVLQGVCLLLVVLNLAAWGAIQARGDPRAQPPAPNPLTYGIQTLMRGYPGWNKQDVNELLQEVWNRSQVFEYDQVTQFHLRPFRGKYVNIDGAGFRWVRNQGRWPPDPAAVNVFVFGGSTTFGVGVPDHESIPSFLQQYASDHRRDRPMFVYNFGRPLYFSTQEALLLHSLAAEGITPHVAIFLDGLNDFYHADGRLFFTDQLGSIVNGSNRQLKLGWAADLALVRSVDWLGRKLRPAAPPVSALDETGLQSTIRRWAQNKRLIESICGGLGVRPLFVWQPVPNYKYAFEYHLLYNGDDRPFRYIERSRHGYARMERLRPELEAGGNFLWLADLQQGRRENLYVDAVHYTGAFCREIAGQIYDWMVKQGLRS